MTPNRELYGYGYDAYLYTENQAEILKSCKAAGAKIVRDLSQTDYDNNEFVVEDADGRWIAFGLKNSK